MYTRNNGLFRLRFFGKPAKSALRSKMTLSFPESDRICIILHKPAGQANPSLPKRGGAACTKDISRVYVVVGYTTKKHVDERYNAERRMMILRKGLLALIFFLLLFIVMDRTLSIFNYNEIKQMFGFSSWSELLKNDPFSERKETEPTAPSVTTATVSSADANQTDA
jgi:hypothetical protein